MARRGENIYHRKDGRWEGRYIKERSTTGSIHYGYIYAYSYTEVKQRLSIKKVQYFQAEQQTTDYRGTVGEWFMFWMNNEIRILCKPSTYDSYQSKINCHILPILGNKRLNRLTILDIEQFIAETKKRVSTASLHSIFRVLKRGLCDAEKKGIIQKIAYENLDLPRLNTKKKRILTEKEYQLIVQASAKGKKNLAVLLALETGLRIGELAGLHWEDIDEQRQVLTVKRTLQRVKEQDETNNKRTYLIELAPKTPSSYREMPLSDGIFHYLMQEKGDGGKKYILSSGQKPIEPRTIRYRFKQLLEQLQLADMSFHSLRHSFASRALNKGVAASVISAILGHTSTKLTLDIYTHSNEEEERKAMKLLSVL